MRVASWRNSGVPEVTLVYRRTAAEMPGYAHELAAARREGLRCWSAACEELVRDRGAG